MNWFTRTVEKFFPTPTAKEVAAAQLAAAERQLLESESQQEYHAAMCDYYRTSIARLRKKVKE